MTGLDRPGSRGDETTTSVSRPGHHRQTVVMLTTSYPRFPGDGIATFLEQIAHGVAGRGHDVHVVAPWHPRVRRPPREDGVQFHFFRYAPTARLHVFGYAAALKADVALRPVTYLVAPLAIRAGCSMVRRVVRRTHASIIHAHWVVPGGAMAALSQTGVPVVVSLHGSDVFLAEVNPVARLAARLAFRHAFWVTACSEDLRRRAVGLGADPNAMTVIPYGVDTDRFRPDAQARARIRRDRRVGAGDPIVFTAGRLVRKKGFEFLIDAMVCLTERSPRVTLVIAGRGDLEDELRQRAVTRRVAENIVFLGTVPQGDIAEWLAAADVAVVPSVRDDAGNVDGLPNVLLEALSSGTPVVATSAGGMGLVAVDGQTARVVPERDVAALAGAVGELLGQPSDAAALGARARTEMCRAYAWTRIAERFSDTYEKAIENSRRRG